MIRDDWVLRQIAALARALAAIRARVARGEVEQAETALSDQCTEVVGVSMALMDKLPVGAVVGVASGLEPRLAQALADVFVAGADIAEAAGDGDLAGRRREKAAAVRG